MGLSTIILLILFVCIPLYFVNFVWLKEIKKADIDNTWKWVFLIASIIPGLCLILAMVAALIIVLKEFISKFFSDYFN